MGRGQRNALQDEGSHDMKVWPMVTGTFRQADSNRENLPSLKMQGRGNSDMDDSKTSPHGRKDSPAISISNLQLNLQVTTTEP